MTSPAPAEIASQPAAWRGLCLEGEYDSSVDDRQSVQPMLELIEHLTGHRIVHRNAFTVAEFERQLQRWRDQHVQADVIYFAGHGWPNGMQLSDGQDVELDRIAELLGSTASGAVIHFGACSLMRAPQDAIARFAKKTGARYVCGYTKEVEWIDSAAFDLALLHSLATYTRPGDALRRMVGPAFSSLAGALGFARYPEAATASA